MNAQQVREKISQPGFQKLGERNGLEYYSMCHVESGRWLYGPLYSFDWEDEVLVEHNSSEFDFRTKKRKIFFPHSKHRTFLEMTPEGFDQFFSIYRNTYEEMINREPRLPEATLDTIHTVNTYSAKEKP